MSVVFICIPLKHQKTRGFLIFSEDAERDQWHNPPSLYVLYWFNFRFIQLSVKKINTFTRLINFLTQWHGIKSFWWNVFTIGDYKDRWRQALPKIILETSFAQFVSICIRIHQVGKGITEAAAWKFSVEKELFLQKWLVIISA